MADNAPIDTRNGSGGNSIKDLTVLDLVNGLALPAASKQDISAGPRNDGQISVVAVLTQRDYEDESAPISVVVTGNEADVKKVLQQLRNNDWNSFQFLDPETRKPVSLSY